MGNVQTCGYCMRAVSQDGPAWVDDTGGDVCDGDLVTGANENLPHTVWNPIDGIDPGACTDFVDDTEPGSEDHGRRCGRCFHNHGPLPGAPGVPPQPSEGTGMAVWRVEGTIHTDVYTYVEAPSLQAAIVKAESIPGREWQEHGGSEVEVVSSEFFQDADRYQRD